MISFDKSIFFYDPFPHCVVKNFLEDSLYSEICNEYPDHSLFQKMEEKKSNQKKFEKFYFGNINNNLSFNGFIKKTKALKEFYKYVNSRQFLNSLNDFLIKNYIDLKINNKNQSKLSIIKNLFKKKILDFEFSSIPINNGLILPHTDGGNKLLGFVIPIIDNNEILKVKNIGTKVLKANSNQFKYNFFNKTVPFEKTELIRELPFERNQMSLHVKTFNSLHGVGPFNNNELDINLYRKSISMFLLK